MEKVDVGKKVLNANEVYALKNSQLLARYGTPCFNIISSPGSGKTTILVRTITDLTGKLRLGVIEGRHSDGYRRPADQGRESTRHPDQHGRSMSPVRCPGKPRPDRIAFG